MTTPAPTIGKWDAELFARYRAAPEGPLKRRLLGEIVMVNRPLCKVLVSQLLGISERRKGLRHSMGRLPGAERLEWEEAENAGMMGFAEAVKRFDPTKGKISFFALHRIRHELQCAISKETAVYTPRGREAEVNGIAYFDESSDLDELVHKHRADGMDGSTDDREDGDRSEEEGAVEWQQIRPVGAANDWQNPVPLASPLEAFIETRLEFLRRGREARSTLFGAFAHFIHGLSRRPAVESALLESLTLRGVRKMTVRVPWADGPVAGFGGVVVRHSL
jgi:hypothetical protein